MILVLTEFPYKCCIVKSGSWIAMPINRLFKKKNRNLGLLEWKRVNIKLASYFLLPTSKYFWQLQAYWNHQHQPYNKKRKPADQHILWGFFYKCFELSFIHFLGVFWGYSQSSSKWNDVGLECFFLMLVVP